MTKTFDELLESVNVGDTVTGFLKADLKSTHHQQLQKARHDWLREEIVKLEGMKEDGETPLGTQELHETELAYNQALQTIIDRYRSELDQDLTTNK